RPIPFSTYELPFHAIDYCLAVAGIHINDIDHFGYSFDPAILLANHRDNPLIPIPLVPGIKGQDGFLSPWDPLFLSMINNAPAHLADGWPHHLQPRFLNAQVCKDRWHFVDHHLSHAASAFYVSPYTEAAVMTVDGRGEKATTAYYTGSGNKLEKIGQVNMPHSLGLLYERVTTHLGFLHSSDEYKVMALASYGKPVFIKTFRDMIDLKDDGTYTVYQGDLTAALGPMRKKGDEFTAHHFDIAHSLQQVLQETILKITQWLHKKTGQKNLCMAGGVALNCVLNAHLRDRGPFENIWVQPAAGDAGTALGAAYAIEASINGHARNFVMEHAYWGPSYSDDAIEKFLQWAKVPYRKMKNVADDTAALLAEDKIIGWYQGRMEFGPRALGSRSILASPINASMQARLNEVKDREDFRPVAPVVLEEDANEWFEGADYSPFMLFVHNVRPDKANAIPAVRHVDGTARIQTVNRSQHPAYYDLLAAFKKLTGVPVLVNTSFNTLGKPIVCTPRDAVECFWTSPFDALVIGSFLVQK
ncbi:MAG TPA: carbamoyltransferase C-terminal domain-containing protein, partial [Ohtaekwangia sp.]|nr:carbamoyltransferase C-terminal domain-containing protein [Ohtaekwangia sp.]